MSVKLYVSEGQKSVDLELSKPNNLQVLNIIHGLFGSLGYEMIEVAKPIQKSVSFDPILPKPMVIDKAEIGVN